MYKTTGTNGRPDRKRADCKNRLKLDFVVYRFSFNNISFVNECKIYDNK